MLAGRLADSRASAPFRNWVFPGILTLAVRGPRGEAGPGCCWNLPGAGSLARAPAPRVDANAEPWDHSSQLCHSPLGRKGSDRDIYFPRGVEFGQCQETTFEETRETGSTPALTPAKVRMGEEGGHEFQHLGQRLWGGRREGHGAGPQAALGWTPYTAPRPAMRQDDPCLIPTRLRVEWPDCGS